jgi:hypothetical protein
MRDGYISLTNGISTIFNVHGKFGVLATAVPIRKLLSIQARCKIRWNEMDDERRAGTANRARNDSHEIRGL